MSRKVRDIAVMERETIEWSNNWWEAANNPEKDRIALLGDSVTRGFRSSLNENVADSYVVDLCASSSAISDDLLRKEIVFFFEEGGYHYNAVMVHMGMQHGFHMQCHLREDDGKVYREKYKELTKLIKTYCENIIFISGTPTVRPDNLKSPNIERNLEIKKRNEIMREIALENNAAYIDLYSRLEEGEYIHTDWIHFDKEANKTIGKILASYVVS